MRVALTATGNATPRPAPADTTPARVRIALGHMRLRDLLAHGLRARITVSEPCSLDLRLLLDHRSAKRLHLAAATPVLVGHSTARMTDPGATTVTVKLTKRARARLGHARRVTLTLAVLARDPAGNVRRTRPEA